MSTVDKARLRELAEEAGHWSGSFTHTWQSDAPDYGGIWQVGVIDEDGNQYPVIEVDADQYDAPGDSGKIARFFAAANPATILALLNEIDRLKSSVKANRCDYPAIHDSDVELLVWVTEGASQAELAREAGCTQPNIGRKIRRIKERLGWRAGMGVAEIRERAGSLQALSRQGAVVAAEVEALRKDKARLDSGCIMTSERDEFGTEYQCERRGLDLRERIDAAMAKGGRTDG